MKHPVRIRNGIAVSASVMQFGAKLKKGKEDALCIMHILSQTHRTVSKEGTRSDTTARSILAMAHLYYTGCNV